MVYDHDMKSLPLDEVRTTISLRVPVRLRRHLDERAYSRHESLNQVILNILEAEFDDNVA